MRPSTHCAAAAKSQSDSYIWHIRMAVMLTSARFRSEVPGTKIAARLRGFRSAALASGMPTPRGIASSPSNVQSMPAQRFARPSEVPGLAARRIAADVLDGVLHKHRTLDDQLDGPA